MTERLIFLALIAATGYLGIAIGRILYLIGEDIWFSVHWRQRNRTRYPFHYTVREYVVHGLGWPAPVWAWITKDDL